MGDHHISGGGHDCSMSKVDRLTEGIKIHGHGHAPDHALGLPID